jgi:hypothetical protein
MRYEAGELSVEVPSNWRDTSDYSYSNQDESIIVRVARIVVVETLPTSGLLNDRKQRFAGMGTVQEIRRGEQQIEGAKGEWIDLEVRKNGPDDDDENHVNVRILALRPSAERIALVTMTGPVARRAELDRVWDQLLRGARLRSTP